jgi:hypothetical protein
MAKRTFVIKIKYGGLGDHLFYSHLPRIAKSVMGYDRVLVSNLSEYRSADYRNLVWERNPFVDGFCDKDAAYPIFARVPPGMNLLDKIMIETGLDDGRRFHEPEIFYRPKLRADLTKALVFDPNFVSNVGAISNSKLNHYLKGSGGIDFQMRARAKSFGTQKDVPILDTMDIFQYCDIIASCKSFFCLNSGGAVLAAALGKPAVVFYGYGQLKMFRHSGLHQYVDVSSLTSRSLWSVINPYQRIVAFLARHWHKLHTKKAQVDTINKNA